MGNSPALIPGTIERRIDRLDQFCRLKNLNDNRLTHECGLSVGTLGKSRKPGKDITPKTAEAILDKYPELNRQWLLTGQGDMFGLQKSSELTSFPLIDIAKAECGKAFGVAFADSKAEFPRISLPGIPSDTEFFVQATGYSMLNREQPELSIPAGALVGLARISGNVIRWGEVYALSTNDGIMIKRILPGETNDNIRCVSYNHTDYPEFSIAKSDIYDLARITCVIPVQLR